MRKIRVELEERSYNIVIKSRVLAETGTAIGKFEFSRLALVSNPTVYGLYGKTVSESLGKAGFRVEEVLIPDGEQYKNLASVNLIYDLLLKAKLDRRSAVLALGGGVIGDIAGFAASTYMRGIDFVQVPTTLLSQVDSSVGGKTGVNHALGKNMIGTFWQPRLVWVDIETLRTLHRRDFLSGLAEVIKYGVIWDADLFNFLETKSKEVLDLDPAALEQIIARSCEIKADVVSNDERESGLRAILNYGHTIGHALETATGYGTYLHGEAVAIGMCAEARLSNLLGFLDKSEVERIRRLALSYGLPAELPETRSELLVSAMALDKKTISGELKFILPEKIGRVKIQGGVSPDDVLKILG